MSLGDLFYGKTGKPIIQIVLLGFVCLCCPGMFNALNGLGAGGMMASDISLTNTANSVLYACFAIVGFFAGSITNTLGVRGSLTIGTFGYAVYASSLWVYDAKKISGYVIAGGAILGCCAGILWSAQGAIMMSYPEEKNKGKYVAIFWALFNIGGILGSIITLGLNLQGSSEAASGGVSSSTYTAFVVIMIIGIFSTLLLAPPTRVVRDDGTRVAVAKNAHWTHELKGVLRVWQDKRILALCPAFLASNWFYAYQFHINALCFNAPTRALNGTMYWSMQILGSLLFGLLLDSQLMSRRTRAMVGCGILFLIFMAVWAGGFVFQLGFENDFDSPMHWTDPGFGGPFVLYLFYGFSDAIYQTFMYWLMGAMSNDPSLLSRYAGFYKAMQSAGAAISFGIDAAGVRLRWACLICWLLVFISFPGMLYVCKVIPQTNMLPNEEHGADAESDYKSDFKSDKEDMQEVEHVSR